MHIESDYEHDCDYGLSSPVAIVVVVIIVVDIPYFISMTTPYP